MPKTKKGRKVALMAGLALVVLAGAMFWTYWEEIGFFLKFKQLGNNAQGYPEYRHRDTGIVMVRVPGGTFMMGSVVNEDRHEVTLSAFLIAKYEVTQADWKRVMGSNPSRFIGDKLPVDDKDYFFWKNYQAFCERASLKLPSEAQWEYACRSGKEEVFLDPTALDRIAWWSKNSGGTTHAVGTKEPNGFGLHDMLGNVWELCCDVFDRDFYKKSDSTGLDPVCRSGSKFPVVRGGSQDMGRISVSSTGRTWGHQSGHGGIVGFRPAYYPLPSGM